MTLKLVLFTGLWQWFDRKECL